MTQRVALLIAVALSLAVLAAGCQQKESSPEPADLGASGPTPMAAAPADEGTEAGQSEFTYYCPMHPDVEQGRPGKCPQCGMFLEAKLEPGQDAVYVCPMPEDQVEQDEPGKCPKCGMYLEARVGERGEGEGAPPADDDEPDEGTG